MSSSSSLSTSSSLSSSSSSSPSSSSSSSSSSYWSASFSSSSSSFAVEAYLGAAYNTIISSVPCVWNRICVSLPVSLTAFAAGILKPMTVWWSNKIFETVIASLHGAVTITTSCIVSCTVTFLTDNEDYIVTGEWWIMLAWYSQWKRALLYQG